MTSDYSAQLLRDNLAQHMGDNDLDPPTVAWRARVDRALIDRLLAADPAAWPCPTKLHRIAYAVGVTPVQLLADPLLG